MNWNTHRILALLAFGLCALIVGCAHDHEHDDDHDHGHGEEGESWAVTAWGSDFEIFAETDNLVVGETSTAFTHVTLLEGFSPLEVGVVSVVLRGAAGAERVFSIDEMTRAGIFSVPVTPEAVGEFDLAFRVETDRRSEEIPAGRVRVAEGEGGHGLVEAAPLSVEAAAAAASGAGAALSFLKEQQWRTTFVTGWVREGALRESLYGPGRIDPAAGGEVVLTAAVDGVVSGAPWPFAGRRIARGETLFRVTPRVASERSLADLEAEVAGLEAESTVASDRLARLERLLELGATSRREVEDARAHHTSVEGRLAAAHKNLATARAGRSGSSTSPESVAIRAPFGGRVARVEATPGEAVAAGAPLGVVVRDSPLWVAVALRPEDAVQARSSSGLDIRMARTRGSLAFRGDDVRLVSISPAVDPETGTVEALFEIGADASELPVGTPVEAEILLAGERTGIVVPETALVDDGGVTVVYLQSGGESFVRMEVEILARQSGQALVNGLPLGGRLVERGGNAIRRASLVNQEAGDGHVH